MQNLRTIKKYAKCIYFLLLFFQKRSALKVLSLAKKSALYTGSLLGAHWSSLRTRLSKVLFTMTMNFRWKCYFGNICIDERVRKYRVP